MLSALFAGLALICIVGVAFRLMLFGGRKKLGLVSIFVWLLVGYVLLDFLKRWLSEAFGSFSLAEQIVVLALASVAAVLLLLPKSVRNVVLGNLVYDILRGLWGFLARGYSLVFGSLASRLFRALKMKF